MKQILLTLAIGSLLVSCKKNDDMPFNKAVAGTWQEQESGASFAGTTYRITFSEDGTYKLMVDYWTDMITGDPCTGPHVIYSYGTYSASNGILTLSGYYSNGTFAYPVPYCNKGTNYADSFHFVFDKGKLVLNSNYANEYAKIKMIKE